MALPLIPLAVSESMIQIAANGIPELLAKLCMALAGLECMYLLMSCATVLVFPIRRQKGWHKPTSVTILKPLDGSEPGLSRRPTSF